MDKSIWISIGGSILFAGVIFFFIFYASKNKPLTMLSEIVEDKWNPGLYHVFGAVSYMPDDAPSFEKYRHYLLNTTDLKVIKGLEQTGADFDIRSPFVARCVEHMKMLTGKNLQLKLVEESEDDDDVTETEEKKLRIVEHDRNESDTSIPQKINGNAIELFDTSFGERNHFSMKIRLDSIEFPVPKVNGMMGVNKYIWRKNEQKLFIFYNRMLLTKFGIGMLVLDTSTGNVIADDYFKANAKA